MKVRNIDKADIIDMIKSYPRTFEDNITNYPEELGCIYLLPSDSSGNAKYVFENWAWFDNVIFNQYPIDELLDWYHKLGGQATLIEDNIYEFSDIDFINLLISKSTINATSREAFQLARLGVFTNVGGHTWMWNKKLLNGELPYTEDINGVEIHQYLLDLINGLYNLGKPGIRYELVF